MEEKNRVLLQVFISPSSALSCSQIGFLLCHCVRVCVYVCVVMAKWVLETPNVAGATTEEVLSTLPDVYMSVCGQILSA